MFGHWLTYALVAFLCTMAGWHLKRGHHNWLTAQGHFDEMKAQRRSGRANIRAGTAQFFMWCMFIAMGAVACFLGWVALTQ